MTPKGYLVIWLFGYFFVFELTAQEGNEVRNETFFFPFVNYFSKRE